MKTGRIIYSLSVVAVILTMLNSGNTFAQKKAKNYYKMDYATNMVFIGDAMVEEPFFVSTKPITNRDYILYLIWIAKTYVDYPSFLINSLPGINDSVMYYFNYYPSSLFYNHDIFELYLKKSEPYVANYIFNTKYLDYPIIGISWQQANNFTRWISDRYNEYSLFENDILAFEQGCKNEDNFSTESYLFDNYVGLLVNTLIFDYPKMHDRIKKFKEIIRPTFHVATSYELEALNKYLKKKKMGTNNGIITDYKKNSFEFLNTFANYYLTNINGNLALGKIYLHDDNDFILTYNLTEKFSHPDIFSEWCLDSYISNRFYNLTKIYVEYGFVEKPFNETVKKREDYVLERKDSLGIFPYIIIGDREMELFNILKTTKLEPPKNGIDVPFIYDHITNKVVNENGGVFTTFRVAVNAIKKK